MYKNNKRTIENFNNRFIIVTFLILLVLGGPVQAFDSFTIEDIKFEGLQRITLGTAFNYLPIKVGETLTTEGLTDALKALHKTEFFDDVSISRDGNTLVIAVKERPSIASIKLFGNKEINSDQLLEALKTNGFAEGRVFRPSLLDQVEQELHRQYFGLGKYGVKIKSSVRPLERNRVDVELDIEEGDAARIKQIKIIGNKAFDEQRLLEKMQLTMPTMWSGFGSNENYSKQQLAGDLETLRSYYLDRGYINFTVTSTQVSISPDKRYVFITINVSEGEKFHVKAVSMVGEMVVPEKELHDLVSLNVGDVFSRQELVNSTNLVTDRLGIDGYAFAKVNAIPDVDNENRTIGLTFFIDPGKRVYVRRINISGNTKTQDEVIRRELRQMEGGWISTPLVSRSKIRLQRLGYFDDVAADTVPVPGTTDQVDLNFKVTEGSTGNFTAGIGYGDTDGLLFNTSVTLNNFLGTGKRIALEVDVSKAKDIYSFSYNNPYYTLDGVSRSFNLSHRQIDASQSNIGDYNANDNTVSVNYGIPLSEHTTWYFGLGYSETKIDLNQTSAPQSYKDWVGINGDAFAGAKANSSFSFDTRNRAIFPDSGLLSKIALEATVPSSDLEYYKTSLQNQFYFPIANQVSLMFEADFAYGDGYGGTEILPFFENYYAGGSRTVRGFDSNSIGPKDTQSLVSVGGNRRLVGKTELFFPSPFMEEPTNKFRFSTFVDAARVWGGGDGVTLDDRLRSTYGLAAVWITPVGAITFSWAWPLRSEEGDKLSRFSFNIGAPF